ncbi:MAG: winged helix-turn-helix transcriptional regulator [candidate division Zixibacteria bacterium]|nr:winged helix-turn-helix transcriptional regulator [candidate division Zixibacteria bacterium]
MIKTDEDVCQVKFINLETVDELRKSLPDNAIIERLAEIFSVLSDPTRLKICIFLSQAELCVCDLAALLGISESGVSHQLRLLRSLRLVKYRREGKMAFYALDDAHVTTLINQGMVHAEEKK